MIDKMPVLFTLQDGTEVHKGDILFHPDRRTVGWYCRAEFKSEGGVSVTVRSPGGAVPTVLIADLRRSSPDPPDRCGTCGQIIPATDDYYPPKRYRVNDDI